MTDTEILEDLKKIIHNQFGINQEDIEEESYLDEDLNITEVEKEDLISAIQEKYDITIPQNTISSLKKVSDIVNYIYENVDTTI